MLDCRQNKDLIIVHCDYCASTIRLYASGLTETLDECIEGHGWTVRKSVGTIPNIGDWFATEHTCRACVRKGR